MYHSEIYCIKRNDMLQSNFYELSTFYFFTQKGKKCMTSFSTVSLGKRNMRATLRTFLMGSCTLNTSQRMDSSEQQVQNNLNTSQRIGFFRATSAEQKQKEVHVSLQINTDGVALFNSSKFSIWPVYCLINELPPKCRYITT